MREECPNCGSSCMVSQGREASGERKMCNHCGLSFTDTSDVLSPEDLYFLFSCGIAA